MGEIDLKRAEHRVEAFNDLAFAFESGGNDDAATQCRNAACMQIVSAGVLTWAQIRERGNSEWPEFSDPEIPVYRTDGDT